MSSILESELRELRRQKKKAIEKNSLREISEICNAIGNNLAKQGEYEEALKEHEVEKNACEALGDTVGVAVACRNLGERYSDLGKHEEALIHLQKHLDLSIDAGDQLEEQRALATIGRTYLYQAESAVTEKHEEVDSLNKAHKAFRSSLDVCERIKSKVAEKEYMEMKGRLYLNIGLVFEHRGDLKQCADFMQQAIKIFEENMLIEDLHRAQYSLACTYQQHGRLSNALKHIQEAINCAQGFRDKSHICDSLMEKAKISFHLCDFQGARVSLRKARKFNISKVEHDLETHLRIATTLCHAEDKLISVRIEDYAARLPLYDRMGDACAHVGNYSQAIEYYTKALECAEHLGESEQNKVPFYVSIGQTYQDLKDYDKAIEFYQRELKCWKDNPKECCRTWVKIAQCTDEKGSPRATVEKLFRKAYECAKQDKNPSLQLECLNELVEFQEGEAKERTKELITALGDVDSDEEPVEDSQNRAWSEISDDSEPEETSVIGQTGRRSSVKKFKVNLLGETPLHLASKEGNLNKVRMLVEQKHQVNVRDNSGWLPLHEACNSGAIDVVEYLLDHGAWINDRGGSACGGCTPLHDAASCGFIDIVQLLIGRGASALARTDKDETPLDNLIQFRKEHGHDLRPEDVVLYTDMEQKLKDMMSRVGHEFPSVAHASSSSENSQSRERYAYDTKRSNSSHDTNRKKKSPASNTQNSRRRYETEEEECFTTTTVTSSEFELEHKSRRPATISADSEDSDEAPTGTNFERKAAKHKYVDAMKAMGSRASRVTSGTILLSAHPPNRKQLPALIPVEQVVPVDDWLIEDQPSTSKSVKRKRTNLDAPFSSNNRDKDVSCKRTARSVMSSNNTRKPRRLRQPKLNAYIKSSDRTKDTLFDFEENSTESSHYSESEKSVTGEEVQDSPAPVPVPVPPLPPAATQLTAMMRIKVTIQDNKLLIPVAQSDIDKSVLWLAQEAAQRYYAIKGLKPLLTLTTKDGAVLAAGDPISLVIATNEEISAIVDSWDLPPLADRYVSACQGLHAIMYSNVRNALEASQTTWSLALRDTAMPPAHIRPVLRALQCQYSLRHLLLPGNKLGDESMQMLGNTLSSLTSLSTLNLQCNGISGVGLKMLVNALASPPSTTYGTLDVTPFENLSELDMSYNPLGDRCTQELAALLARLPSLNVLTLESCQFTVRLFQQHQQELANALTKCNNMNEVSFAFNNLGSTGVELMLKCLHNDKLKKLNLTSTVSCESVNFSKHLQAWLTQSSSTLEQLLLADCNLTDTAVNDIASWIGKSVSLKRLSLANNPLITSSSIVNIVRSSKDRGQALESLDVCGCPSILAASKHTTLHSLLDPFVLSYLPLKMSGIPEVCRETLHESWRTICDNQTMASRTGTKPHMLVRSTE